MKKGTKIIIAGGAVLLVALMLIPTLLSALNAAKGITRGVSGTALQKLSLISTVSATGTVESVTSKEIYSTANYAVETIDVKLGDVVTMGQLLCSLDSADLESQIAQKEVSMQSSSINTYYQLSQSEKKYNEARNNYDNGLNVEMNNAKGSLTRAEQDLNTAKENLEKAQSDLNSQNRDKLLDAKDELRLADGALGIAKRDYEEELNDDRYTNKAEMLAEEEKRLSAKAKLTAAKSALKVAQSEGASTIEAATAAVITAQTDYEKAEKKLTDIFPGYTLIGRYMKFSAAETAYDEKKSALDSILAAIGGDIVGYSRAVDSAELAYNNAAVAYEATKVSALSQLDTYRTAMENDRATMSNEPQLLELDSMKKKLKACTVTAPIAGTVTAVNVTEGAPASGVLFVVEDIDALKINATIKEYDIGAIAVGMKATVTSDATGDEKFEGTVTSVAPTAGKSVQSGGFKAEVTLSAKDTPLLIGMNTRVNIVTEEKNDAFGIRYDAIGKNADGKDVVYAARPLVGEAGAVGTTYTAEEIPVSVGMETDFEVEISSDALKVGDIIITDIDGIKSGSVVMLKK